MRPQGFRAQPRVRQVAHAYRYVDALLNDVRIRVAQAQVNGELWVTLAKSGKGWRQDVQADRRRRGDLQCAGRLGPRGHGGLIDLFHLAQNAQGTLVQIPSLRGQGERAGGPAEQLQLEVLFKTLHAFADG